MRPGLFLLEERKSTLSGCVRESAAGAPDGALNLRSREIAQEPLWNRAVWSLVMKTISFTPTSQRARRPVLPLLVIGGLTALLSGCVTEPESHVVSAPPPGAPVTATTTTTTSTPMVYTAPAAAPGTNTIVVTQAPPSPQQEVVSARPSSDHVWVGGYWTWRNDRYEWVAGHWVVPPHTGATWIPPRWTAESGAYRFYEGYWE
jgi:hypothetical protein